MFTHASKASNPITNIVLVPSAFCQKQIVYIWILRWMQSMDNLSFTLKEKGKGFRLRLHLMLSFPGIKV
jgi:hypothetical protein